MELSVNVFVSLDGVMQGPGGPEEDTAHGFTRGGWLVPHAAEGQLDPVDGWFREADAFLLGRTTFAMMRTYWSQVTDADNLVATALNTWKKYVVSTTLSDADAAWGDTTVLRGGSGAVSLTLRQDAFGSIGTGEFVVVDGKEAVA